MNRKPKRRSREKKAAPLVVGTGLIALDVVISKSEPTRYYGGGTCGNVLTILAYLGWRVQPVARLGKSDATEMILADLRHWKVSDRFVRLDEDGRTPVIEHRITHNAQGIPRHSFSWRCSDCGASFPGYRAELATVAESVSESLNDPRVFFFDRVSAGALILAKSCADAGALVVFEPSGIGNPILFRQAWELAHVVKYSHERLTELPEMDVAAAPRMEIETLGDAGLRYRRRANGNRSGRWIELKALPISNVKDTAGAGDWCTAGLISRIGGEGLRGFLGTSDQQLREAVRYGQALAAWNCGFEGARGGMYAVKRRAFEEQICKIQKGVSGSTALSIGHLDNRKAEGNAHCHFCHVATSPKRHTGTGR